MRIVSSVWISFCVCAALLGCAKYASQQEVSAEALSIFTNVFAFHLTNQWTVLKADRQTSGTLVGRPATDYYLVQVGSQEAVAEALAGLERHSGDAVVRGTADLGATHSGRPAWWSPDREDVGSWTRLHVRTNSTHYFWWLYLFDRSTNAALYSHLTVVP